MSPLGQKRHFDRASLTSGLPRLADILRADRHVSNVPKADILRRGSDVASPLPQLPPEADGRQRKKRRGDEVQLLATPTGKAPRRPIVS